MAYPSVDQLQKVLTDKVFHYAKDSKKAAGRALGTLVEIITFYALKSWGFERNVAIERPLPEFANNDIMHNVEYSLHPCTLLKRIEFSRHTLPLTAKKIVASGQLVKFGIPAGCPLKANVLLTKELILRNACTICDLNSNFLNAYLEDLDTQKRRVSL